MIKKLCTWILFLAPAFVFAQATETRELSSLRGVEVGGNFTTFLEKGDKESIRIVAEGIDPKNIITEIKDGELKVYPEHGNLRKMKDLLDYNRKYRNIKVSLYITCKDIQSIGNSGSGSLSSGSDFSGDHFSIGSSGSGNILLKGKIRAGEASIHSSGSGSVELGQLEARQLEIAVSGSGNLKITSGQVTDQSVRLSGSGSISTYGLKSDTCSVAISGSGSVNVYADKSLDGTIAGSGNINYKGDAAITGSRIAGSGRINKK